MTAVLLSDHVSGIYNYYSLQWQEGDEALYLSYYEVIARRAIVYKDPLQLWFEYPGGAHADDQITTGTPIYVMASMPLPHSLAGDSDTDVSWGKFGIDAPYEFMMFTDYEGTTGVGINVGDVVYLLWVPGNPPAPSWLGVALPNVQLFSGPSPFVVNSDSDLVKHT